MYFEYFLIPFVFTRSDGPIIQRHETRDFFRFWFYMCKHSHMHIVHFKIILNLAFGRVTPSVRELLHRHTKYMKMETEMLTYLVNAVKKLNDQKAHSNKLVKVTEV